MQKAFYFKTYLDFFVVYRPNAFSFETFPSFISRQTPV